MIFTFGFGLLIGFGCGVSWASYRAGRWYRERLTYFIAERERLEKERA